MAERENPKFTVVFSLDYKPVKKLVFEKIPSDAIDIDLGSTTEVELYIPCAAEWADNIAKLITPTLNELTDRGFSTSSHNISKTALTIANKILRKDFYINGGVNNLVFDSLYGDDKESYFDRWYGELVEDSTPTLQYNFGNTLIIDLTHLRDTDVDPERYHEIVNFI